MYNMPNSAIPSELSLWEIAIDNWWLIVPLVVLMVLAARKE